MGKDSIRRTSLTVQMYRYVTFPAVCVCVCLRGGERACVCVCMCVCERERERESLRVCVRERPAACESEKQSWKTHKTLRECNEGSASAPHLAIGRTAPFPKRVLDARRRLPTGLCAVAVEGALPAHTLLLANILGDLTKISRRCQHHSRFHLLYYLTMQSTSPPRQGGGISKCS
jgi:hypothetical protein